MGRAATWTGHGRRTVVVLLVVLPLAMATGLLPAGATVVEALGLEQLAARAQLVVRGRVESSSSAWDESNRRIFTRTRLQAAEVLKQGAAGQASGNGIVEVVVPGGEVGGIGQLVAGAPRFVPGEEVLLFLEATKRGWTPVALSLGKFTLRPDEQGLLRAVRDLTNLHFSGPAGGGSEPGSASVPPSDVPLGDILEALKRVSR